MTKDSKIAVLGDQQIAAQVRAALKAEGFKATDEGELEIQDEFQVLRWMQAENPTHVFLCVGLKGQASIPTFMFTIAGSINVLKGAAGIAQRVRMISTMPTVEYFLMRRLCELYFFEKELDYADILYSAKEKPQEYFRRCVLSMRDVSAKEAHASRTKGPKQGREVRGQVVPQQAGGQQHGSDAQAVLEAPLTAAQGAPPGDVCPQPSPAAGQMAAHPLHDHIGSVQGVVS